MSDVTDPLHEPEEPTFWRRVLTTVGVELVGVHPRLQLYTTLAAVLPQAAAGNLRARLLRRLGFDIGEGTQVNGPLKITGPRCLLPRLTIGRDCTIESDCVLDVSAALSIGDRVTLEPCVMILTSTHELDSPRHRAGKVITNPVTIGDGALLRARSVVLPGVNIGAGAIVEVGAVVNKDVESNTRVGGVPAIKLGFLENQDKSRVDVRKVADTRTSD